MKLRAKRMMWKTAAAVVAAVSSVSSPSGTEGTTLVHTVTLTSAPTSNLTFPLSLVGASATAGGIDFSSTLTNGSFSNGVTISGGLITVPSGVASFMVSVVTINDSAVESTETYTLTIGGISGTGTILDNDTFGGGSGVTNVPFPAGPASFTARDWLQIEGADGYVLIGSNASQRFGDLELYPYRYSINNPATLSLLITGVVAGPKFIRVAPLLGGVIQEHLIGPEVPYTAA